MKLLLITFFSLLVTTASAQKVFIEQKDKHLHFVGGYFFGAVGYSYVYLKTENKKKAIIGSIASAVLVGAIKETLDSTGSKNKFDMEDLGATAIGGLTIGITINLFNNKKRIEFNYE